MGRDVRRGGSSNPYRDVIDAWLRADPLLKASVIHERLAAEPYGFAGHYQRVKIYVRERRPQILAELGHDEAHGGFHARFTTTPGAQAQVDWGDEGTITTPVGDLPVNSFHMVLSCSRDPFCRFTTSMDLATFWACHREAFAHFAGVPASILYDRTKTVVRYGDVVSVQTGSVASYAQKSKVMTTPPPVAALGGLACPTTGGSVTSIADATA